jgi:hypothetical protein
MHRSGRTNRAVAVVAAAVVIPVVLSFGTPAGGSPPHVNLIERANFEVPIAEDSLARLYAPGSHIGPWTVSGATVGVGRPFPPIVTGISGRNLQFLSLKDPFSVGIPSGMVCQRVAIDPSASYRLRFYSAAATLDDTLVVIWRGRTVARFVETGSVGTTNWQFHQIALGPAAGALRGDLCFTAEGDGYPLVDAVHLHSTTP